MRQFIQILVCKLIAWNKENKAVMPSTPMVKKKNLKEFALTGITQRKGARDGQVFNTAKTWTQGWGQTTVKMKKRNIPPL